MTERVYSPPVSGRFVCARPTEDRVQGEWKGESRLPRWRKGEQTGTVTIDGQEEAFTALVPKGYSTRKKYPPLLISLERCHNNFASREEAERVLKEKGYEVVVHEHAQGHSVPRKPIAQVFEWIAADVKASRRRR